MKTTCNHRITIHPVHTETGGVAPAGTHGFVLSVLGASDERYVAEVYLNDPPDKTELTVLLPLDFEVARGHTRVRRRPNPHHADGRHPCYRRRSP